MKRTALLLLLALSTRADDWPATLDAIRKIKDPALALKAIAQEEERLAKEAGAPALYRRAELLARCKIARVPLMQKAQVSFQAIQLCEQVLDKEPGHADARYLLVRTCLGLPEFMGKRDQGIVELKRLIEMQKENPEAVPFRDLDELLKKYAPQRPATGIDDGGARERFRLALEKNRIDFAQLDADLHAEQKRSKHHSYATARGLLRLWLLAQRDIQPQRAAQAAGEAIQLFEQSLPHDTRVYGWLGPLCLITGHQSGQQPLIDRGRKLLEEGVRKNPEQNLFSRAFAHLALGGPENLAAAEEDFYKTIELCTGNPVDRTGFELGEVKRDHPACRNPRTAPHNIEGTLFFAAEVFRQRKKKDHAIAAYRAAIAADSNKTWPYRDLAIARTTQLENPDGTRPAPAPASCALCHQR